MTGNINEKTVQQVYGQGVNDGTYPTRVNGKRHPAYNTWCAMLQRCYDVKHQERNPTYEGCTVAPEWLHYSNFYQWWAIHHVEGWELDKDTIAHGNKHYSPETCCYIPSEINSFMHFRKKKDSNAPQGCTKLATGKWKVRLRVDGKQKYLGYFRSTLEAIDTYWQAKIEVARHFIDKYPKLNRRAFYKLFDTLGRQWFEETKLHCPESLPCYVC